MENRGLALILHDARGVSEKKDKGSCREKREGTLPFGGLEVRCR